MNIVVRNVANTLGKKHTDVKEVIDAFLAEVKELVRSGEKLSFKEFGSFETKKRQARKVRNPRTGEELQVPEKNAVVFRASKSFKVYVNS